VLPKLKSGEILEVLCDCPQSINSIPQDVKNRGFKVLEIDQSGPTLRFLIQKP
ncbi:MAG: sulfurtransferase-like selenium metabolism protein YedF, partial [Campylobacter jejuni]|nr:sulfurtransferase-like selenium metabolism protein YedF [Campylobacter jejuni]